MRVEREGGGEGHSGSETREERKGKHGRVYFFEAADRRIKQDPRFSPRIRTARHRASGAILFMRRWVRRYDCCSISFFLCKLFFSTIPSIPIFLSFYITSCAECMNPIFVKVTRETNAVNRRKAMADLCVSQLETRERWDWPVRKILIIKKSARNRKRLLFSILPILFMPPLSSMKS